MYALAQNFRFAFRRLRQAPGFALTAILVLALGIGATTAIFSLVEGILLRPLPFSHPDRLVLLGDHLRGSPNTHRHGSRNRHILERNRRLFLSWRLREHDL